MFFHYGYEWMFCGKALALWRLEIQYGRVQWMTSDKTRDAKIIADTELRRGEIEGNLPGGGDL